MIAPTDPALVMRDEEWRAAPGFPGYQVSSHGRLKALARSIRRAHHRTFTEYDVTYKEHLLAPYEKRRKNGDVVALVVNLRRGGQTRTVRVHRLILEAFCGPCPKGMEGCHNDGNPLNNHVENLRWDTHAANMADQYKHGTKANPPTYYGEEHPSSKLTKVAVAYIRSHRYRRGLYTRLGRELGVSHQAVRNAYLSKTWCDAGQRAS